MNNDDKLREQMKSEPVPERLRPENIKIMLDNEAPKKKRSGISVANRIAAAAAACAVIGGTAVYTMNNGKLDRNQKSGITEKSEPETTTLPKPTDAEGKTAQPSYMSSAKDYEQVYDLFSKSKKKAEKENLKYNNFKYEDIAEEADETVSSIDTPETGGGKGGGIGGESPVPEVPLTEGELPTEPDTEPVSTELTTENTAEPTTEEPTTEADPEHSDTYYQEQDVLEADIVKTDGKHIYYIGSGVNENGYYSSVLRVANVKDGKFISSTTVDVQGQMGEDHSVNFSDMYIYNDMIVILGTDSYYNYDENYYHTTTFVAFYTAGDSPELIDVYKQEGSYNDVRISPEGYLLLLSSYVSWNYEDVNGCEEINKYIPGYGFTDNFGTIPAEDILLPNDIDSRLWLDYSVIASIDLNNSGAPELHDIKTLAGFTGSIYCSADNLYTASGSWSSGCTTDITRISIKDGNIVPEAGCTINGIVKDQFSMSEYNGLFRVAATYTEEKETFHKYSDGDNIFESVWNRIKGEGEDGYYSYEVVKKDSRVYVLDMDMNMIGSVDGLGPDEEIKSASFSGNIAYVVTFRQTDPLYAVDLSDPTAPTVLDELKINGFSTYMQSWSEGLLLGFGQNADDNGRITGIKLTLFNNSDPNALKTADTYTWDIPQYDYTFWEDVYGKTYEYYSSTAVWDRKALLIAPEKNLIGVPIQHEATTYSPYDDDLGGYVDSTTVTTYQYVFFSVEDGKLVRKGDVSASMEGYDYYNASAYDRAIYIGDHIYTLSSNRFTASDINTLETTDELNFNFGYTE